VLSESAEDLKLYDWLAAGPSPLRTRKSLFSVLGFAGGRRQRAGSS
jgi:hypothetical protein